MVQVVQNQSISQSLGKMQTCFVVLSYYGLRITTREQVKNGAKLKSTAPLPMLVLAPSGFRTGLLN